MSNRSLPPLVLDINEGQVSWGRLENVDFDTLGFFLSCHLIIEHYIDEFLEITSPNLDWNASRLSFSQKISLISSLITKLENVQRYNFIPAVKSLNKLRNKLAHDIQYKIQNKDVSDMRKFLKEKDDSGRVVPTDTFAVLQEFTLATCSFLGGFIAGHAFYTKQSKKKN